MRFLMLMLLLVSCGPKPKYHNLIPTPLTTGGVSMSYAAWAFFFDDDPRVEPDKELPYKKLDTREVTDRFAAIWLGHATTLLKLDTDWVLLDPVFSDRLSHWTGVWPKRFHPLPIDPTALPKLKAVVISHDHQDHLDEPTIKQLNGITEWFIVPRDVGAWLVDWGVDRKKIIELGWWDKTTLGVLEFTCTPARHGSGRMPLDWDQTLWSGWSIRHPEQNIYFAGDTGFFPQFTEIGERLGPFDLTLMPIGAYDKYWANIHLNPEEAVAAHKLLKGRMLMPVHWGTFDLSRHAWDDPILRFKQASQELPHVTPLPGEVVQLKATTR